PRPPTLSLQARTLLMRILFLLIRRPPRSTLFPYTRSSDLARRGGWRWNNRASRPDDATPWAARADGRRAGDPRAGRDRGRARARSEEHTSELQSRRDLVCRPPLEKKKERSPRPGRPRSAPA